MKFKEFLKTAGKEFKSTAKEVGKVAVRAAKETPGQMLKPWTILKKKPEDKVDEMFGAFFGGKVKPNDKTLDKKFKSMPLAQQKAMIAAQNAKNNKKPGNVPDKHGSRRADDFAFALNGGRPTNESFGKRVKINYKGYTISKTDDGQYHIMKGPRFIGHGKDHQTAMQVIDRDLMRNESVLEGFDSIDVHDISQVDDKYGETQTNDKIKDGDVLHLGGNKTGVMMKAWPVEVTGNHAEESGFHRLKPGVTWDKFQDGDYAASARKAQEVASKFEDPT